MASYEDYLDAYLSRPWWGRPIVALAEAIFGHHWYVGVGIPHGREFCPRCLTWRKVPWRKISMPEYIEPTYVPEPEKSNWDILVDSMQLDFEERVDFINYIRNGRGYAECYHTSTNMEGLLSIYHEWRLGVIKADLKDCAGPR